MSGGIEGGRSHFERIPQQSQPTEQHKPHQEGGKPPPENTTTTPQSRRREKLRNAKLIFDCALPEVIFSPYDIQRKHAHEITKEQAIEEGQPWVGQLKILDRQELERRLTAIKKYKREILTFPYRDFSKYRC